MHAGRIVAVEWGRMEGRRPRAAGSNARLGDHGVVVRLPILRLTTDTGLTAFGACHTAPERTRELLGASFDDVFDATNGVREPYLPFEFALWDLAGKQADRPVYALAASLAGKTVQAPFRAPCYDTSLYFDDLQLDDAAAVELLVAEARFGYERGHRAFKLKVGRGARHLPLEQGTARDIAIIRAVRAAVGSEPPIMIDANNGYNLNLAKRVLSETADCGIFWLEEAFHEDDVLYRDLKGWMAEQGLATLVSDGEGMADPRLVAWARSGLIDVVQYDIFSYGFTRWLALGRELDAAGVRSAPHHYGAHFGNYAAGHLAGALEHFTFVEWDHVDNPGLDASAYAIVDGYVHIPDLPGFGLKLDDERFAHAVANGGCSLTVS